MGVEDTSDIYIKQYPQHSVSSYSSTCSVTNNTSYPPAHIIPKQKVLIEVNPIENTSLSTSTEVRRDDRFSAQASETSHSLSTSHGLMMPSGLSQYQNHTPVYSNALDPMLDNIPLPMSSDGPLPPIKMFYSDTFRNSIVSSQVLGLMNDPGGTSIPNDVLPEPHIDSMMQSNMSIASSEVRGLPTDCVTVEPASTHILHLMTNETISSETIVTEVLDDLITKVVNEVKFINVVNIIKCTNAGQTKKRKSKAGEPEEKVEGESPKHKESKGYIEKSKRKNPNPRKVEKSILNELIDTAVDSGDEHTEKNLADKSENQKGVIPKSENYVLRGNRSLSVTQTLCVNRRPPKNIVRHVCKLCDMQFTHGRPFKSHLHSHDYVDLCCRLCKEEFKNLALFLHHGCSKSVVSTHPCQRCGHVYTSMRQLNIHMRGVHKISISSLAAKTCTECGEVFVRRSLLYEHVQVRGLSGGMIMYLVISRRSVWTIILCDFTQE